MIDFDTKYLSQLHSKQQLQKSIKCPFTDMDEKEWQIYKNLDKHFMVTPRYISFHDIQSQKDIISDLGYREIIMCTFHSLNTVLNVNHWYQQTTILFTHNISKILLVLTMSESIKDTIVSFNIDVKYLVYGDDVNCLMLKKLSLNLPQSTDRFRYNFSIVSHQRNPNIPFDNLSNHSDTSTNLPNQRIECVNINDIFISSAICKEFKSISEISFISLLIKSENFNNKIVNIVQYNNIKFTTLYVMNKLKYGEYTFLMYKRTHKCDDKHLNFSSMDYAFLTFLNAVEIYVKCDIEFPKNDISFLINVCNKYFSPIFEKEN